MNFSRLVDQKKEFFILILVLCMLYLMTILIIQPVLRYHKNVFLTLDKNIMAVRWLNTASSRLIQLEQKNPKRYNSEQPLMVVIGTSLAGRSFENNVKSNNLIQEENGFIVKIDIRSSSFDDIIQWLQDLDVTESINIKQCRFTSVDPTGLVDFEGMLYR